MIEGIPTPLASLLGVTPAAPATPGTPAPAAPNGAQPDFDALLAMLGIVTEGDVPVDVPEGNVPPVTGDDAAPGDKPQGDLFADAEPLNAALDAGIGAVLALLAQADGKPAPTPTADAESAVKAFAAAVAPAALPARTPHAAAPPSTVAQEIEQAIPQGLQLALAAVTRALAGKQAPGEGARTAARAEAATAPTPTLDTAVSAQPLPAADTGAPASIDTTATAPAAVPSPTPAAAATLASAILPPAPANDTAASAPQPATSDLLITHHLQVEQDGQWLDQLARDIARTAAHDSQLRFKLNPEHLGSLAVEVTHHAEGAAIRFTADNEAARTLIVDAQPKLMAEARAQGLRIAETHVDLGAQGGGQGQGQGQGQAQSQRWFEDQKPFLRTHGLNAETPAESPGASDDERYA